VRSLDAVHHGRLRAALHQFSAGGVALALAVPLVFLHVEYQPSVSLPAGATLKLQEAVLLALSVFAASSARRGGLDRLRAAMPVWIAASLLLAWIVVAAIYPLLSSRTYAWHTHLVTALEFALYGVLALAVPLLVRRRADALLVLGSLAAWTVVNAVIGIVQWLGVDIAHAWPQGTRQPALLGPHDLAALGGAGLVVGVVGLAWDPGDRAMRRGSWLAVISGAIAFVLGGATAGILGLVPAVLIVLAVAARHRLLGRRMVMLALTTAAIASVGVLALRAGDFSQFLRFAGVKKAQANTSSNIQTYSQRTLLAYLGVRIWVRHPIVGVGWQGSTEDAVVVPELPAAHRRFPSLAPLAFPGPGHEYGIQILYLQALADLGVIGLILTLAWLVVPAIAGARAALRGPPGVAWIATIGVSWLVLAMGLWTALGFVAGVPLDALTWLAIGTVAAGCAAGKPEISGRMA
jgi:hypothetical protein